MQRRTTNRMPKLSVDTIAADPLKLMRETETKCVLHTGPAAARIAASSRVTPALGAAPSVAAASAQMTSALPAKPKNMAMTFELLDGYLLDAVPSRAEVVRSLLASPPEAEGASPFYEGMRLLGGRTPELTLIALRLVLAGKRADDAAVVRLRRIVERARSGDLGARDEYRESLQ